MALTSHESIGGCHARGRDEHSLESKNYFAAHTRATSAHTKGQQLLGDARAVIGHQPARQVCEVGSNAGHSAALYLTLRRCTERQSAKWSLYKDPCSRQADMTTSRLTQLAE